MFFECLFSFCVKLCKYFCHGLLIHQKSTEVLSFWHQAQSCSCSLKMGEKPGSMCSVLGCLKRRKIG